LSENKVSGIKNAANDKFMSHRKIILNGRPETKKFIRLFIISYGSTEVEISTIVTA